jgi:hypothetical protein
MIGPAIPCTAGLLYVYTAKKGKSFRHFPKCGKNDDLGVFQSRGKPLTNLPRFIYTPSVKRARSFANASSFTNRAAFPGLRILLVTMAGGGMHDTEKLTR